MESSDITKYIMEFVWPLIKEESGTAIIWTLIGGGLGLLISIFLIIFLWSFLKNRKFLGGKTGPKWPKYLLLISWILLIPIGCVTSGGAWGLVTATEKIAENQKAIEEAVSVALEKPINDRLVNLIELPELSTKQKALLFKQQGDEITVSTFELEKQFTAIEDDIYEMIKGHIFPSSSESEETNNDQSISLPSGVERWIINSILKEHNPASLATEGRVIAKHAESNFGTHASAKELAFSLGAVLVKPHVDKMVKSFKKSIIIAGLVEVAIIVLISLGIAALLVSLVRRLQKKSPET